MEPQSVSITTEYIKLEALLKLANVAGSGAVYQRRQPRRGQRGRCAAGKDAVHAQGDVLYRAGDRGANVL